MPKEKSSKPEGFGKSADRSKAKRKESHIRDGGVTTELPSEKSETNKKN